ncbi:hypothetical protein BH11BAC5_BH11BAC5_31660 [soil metagenome]
MKFFTSTLALVLIATVSFAQSICPDYFRRNNGNGACADGQLKLYFTSCPAGAPIIDSVYTNGVKSNVSFASPDASKCAAQGFIGYCVSGGNMPPASTWVIYFHNAGAVTPFSCNVPEPTGGSLPITIKTFTASRGNNSVVLNWQTALEMNAQLFEIQKKSGNGYITIGTLAATNKENGSTYSYTDISSEKTTSEYRLKMVSGDAAIAYSEIRVVRGTGASFDFTIFPNPATRNTKIALADITQPSTIQVIDNSGRQVRTISVKSSSTIELNDLQPGLYRVRIVTNKSGEALTKSLTIVQ